MKHVKVIKEGKTTVIENQTNQIINIFLANHKELKGLFFDFAIVNLEFFKWLSTQRITGRQCRVLHYLISKMQFENKVTITHQEVSQELKIARSNLSNDLHSLEDRGIIMREKIASKVYEVKLNLSSMYLNHAMIYKGNPKDRVKVKEHKYLASLNVPYHQRKNVFGDYDIINKQTGETIALGNKNASKEYPVVNPPAPNEKDATFIDNADQLFRFMMGAITPKFRQELEKKGIEFLKENPEILEREKNKRK